MCNITNIRNVPVTNKLISNIIPGSVMTHYRNEFLVYGIVGKLKHVPQRQARNNMQTSYAMQTNEEVSETPTT